MHINPTRSLIAYQGNKYQLIRELWSHFPEDIAEFHDVFGGSGAVTINMLGRAKKRFYNEHDEVILDILRAIRESESVEELEFRFDRCVEHFGLGKGNKEEFIEFLDHCNRKPHPLKWLVVSKHCFSNLLRFNSGKCTSTYGDRGFLPCKSRTKKFEATYDGLQDVKMSGKDFRRYLKKLITRVKKKKNRGNVVVYLDPPYLASGDMVYKGTWTEDDDKALFKYCKELDEAGVKWVMSNVFRHGHHVNKPLIKFSKAFNVYHLDANYVLKKGYDQSEQGTEEVLIKNF